MRVSEIPKKMKDFESDLKTITGRCRCEIYSFNVDREAVSVKTTSHSNRYLIHVIQVDTDLSINNIEICKERYIKIQLKQK